MAVLVPLSARGRQGDGALLSLPSYSPVIEDVLVDTREWARWWRQLGQAQLRAVLMDEWDPVGVAAYMDGEYGSRDEYDSYMGGIVALLREGADTERLATHLSSIVAASMGTQSTPLQEAKAAKAILRWWAESPHPT